MHLSYSQIIYNAINVITRFSGLFLKSYFSFIKKCMPFIIQYIIHVEEQAFVSFYVNVLQLLDFYIRKMFSVIYDVFVLKCLFWDSQFINFKEKL